MKLLQLLSKRLTETDDEVLDHDDDHDDGVYEREKKVSVLILRAFRKCGLPVSEHDHKHSGTRDSGDTWGHDVLYDEGDREATVTLDEAELAGLVKLSESGLIDDAHCTISATSKGAVRVTFKVHKAIAKGDAQMEQD